MLLIYVCIVCMYIYICMCVYIYIYIKSSFIVSVFPLEYKPHKGMNFHSVNLEGV